MVAAATDTQPILPFQGAHLQCTVALAHTHTRTRTHPHTSYTCDVAYVTPSQMLANKTSACAHAHTHAHTHIPHMRHCSCGTLPGARQQDQCCVVRCCGRNPCAHRAPGQRVCALHASAPA
eukprot:775640-Pelagomonas_calceolata.AAC.2